MYEFAGGLAIGLVCTVFAALWTSRRTRIRVLKLEKRARGAERLAELGKLTGGLAHEIKNPLSTIGLNLQLLSESIQDLNLQDEQSVGIQNRIRNLSGEVERLRGILQDFLSFAGRVRISTQPVDINQVVEELIDFYAPQAEASGVKLRSRLSPKAGMVHLDVTLFKQALLNLLINATQAMVTAKYEDSDHGGSGDLMISTDVPDPEKHGQEEDIVVIHVIDTGPGMTPESCKKIFQPYYTTKADGTGLGLPTTRRIINEHHGDISVHTEVGIGTDFKIELPREQPVVEGGNAG